MVQTASFLLAMITAGDDGNFAFVVFHRGADCSLLRFYPSTLRGLQPSL